MDFEDAQNWRWGGGVSFKSSGLRKGKHRIKCVNFPTKQTTRDTSGGKLLEAFWRIKHKLDMWMAQTPGKQVSAEESSLGPVTHFLGIGCPEINIRGPRATQPRRGS